MSVDAVIDNERSLGREVLQFLAVASLGILFRDSPAFIERSSYLFALLTLSSSFRAISRHLTASHVVSTLGDVDQDGRADIAVTLLSNRSDAVNGSVSSRLMSSVYILYLGTPPSLDRSVGSINIISLLFMSSPL